MPLWVCGFEAGDQSYYQSLGWNWNGDIQTTAQGPVHQTLAGDGGSYCLYVNDHVTSPTIPGPQSRWLHFWMAGDEPTGANASSTLYFNEPGTASTNASVFLDVYGSIEIRRGTNTTVATSTNRYKPSAAHWFAIEMLADNSGLCNVYVDGVLFVSFSGDLQQQSNPGWDNFRFHGGNQFIVLDDFIATSEEEGRLEECYVLGLAPNGDDTVALTRSTGSNNYETVDEIPPSTTDYNEATATAEDFYDTTNLPFTPGRVVSFGHANYVARDGTITTGQQGIKSGTTTDRKSAVTLGASAVYEEIQAHWDTDPDTSTAVVAVSTGSDTVSIAGDLTSTIADGSFIEITGSTGNDGIYVVESTTFSSPNTVITVTGDITDATVDGNVTYNWTSTTVNAAKTGIKFA